MKNECWPNRWIFRPAPRSTPRVRLFCFPYAGAGAAVFRLWGAKLPPEVEVCAVRPPGRETRLSEPPFDELGPLVAAATEALLPLLDRPFAFFGHSMGALLAYELARGLRRISGAPMPEHLVLSGRRSPRVPSRYPPIWHLSDEAFLEAIEERYGGIPAEIANESQLLRLLLPCLRADVAAVEKHRWVEEEPLDVPITTLCGVGDATTLPEEAELWVRETTGPFAFGAFPGDHFFIQTARDQVIRMVARVLATNGGSSAPVPAAS